MTMPSTLDRPTIATASHDVVASMGRVVKAIVNAESQRVEGRFRSVTRAALLSVPMVVLATAAFVYLISGIERALTDAAAWPLWQARITVAVVLAVGAACALVLAKASARTERPHA